MTILTDVLARYVPQDFQAKLLGFLQTRKITTTDWEVGGVIRTMLVTTATTLAAGFGVPGDQQLTDYMSNPTGYGIVPTYAHGGLLKFAALVSIDPSVQQPDGSYAEFGVSFLDSLADGIYNVQRLGGPVSGPSVETNDTLAVRCVAKLEKVGITLLAEGLDPYVAYATTRYKGAALSQPITRVASIPVLSTGVVAVILANAAGVPSGADVTAVDVFIQASCVPWGITAVVGAATAHAVATTCTVYVPSRYASQAVADATAAILAYLNTTPVGGYPGLAGPVKGVAVSEVVAAVFAALSYVQDVRLMKLNGSTSDVTLVATEVPVSSGIVVTVVST